MFSARPAKKKDANDICDIVKVETNRDFTIAKIEDVISSNPSFVAEVSGKIVGFCYTSQFAPDILEILNIIVLAEHRNMGIGKTLVQRIESEAKKTYDSIVVVNSMLYESSTPKLSATKFYLENGYKVIYTTENTIIFARKIS